MMLRSRFLGAATVLLVVTWSSQAVAQNGPAAPRGAPRQQVAPQPANPQASYPQAPPRQAAAPAQPNTRPFTPRPLTAAEQELLDRTLADWEGRSGSVKSLSCKFRRWERDETFDTETVTDGYLQYEAPDKGLYAIEGNQPEKWVCNGKSIFEFKYDKKQLIEHPLPEELQGESISNGPLPFFFGAKASTLKNRYYLRVITPEDRDGEVWIEAYPRYQRDAANFVKAELILNETDKRELLPYAMKIYLPGGKNHTVHQFYDRNPNGGLLDKIANLSGDPFTPKAPFGWKKLREELPAAAEVPNTVPGPARPQSTQRPQVPGPPRR